MRVQRYTHQSNEAGAAGVQAVRRGALLFFMLATTAVFVAVFLSAL